MINRVGHFEKVSFEQFKNDIKSTFGEKYSDEEIEDIFKDIKLPVRSTSDAAGYDFCSPIDFELNTGETIQMPTGIRAFIDEGWFLMCAPRSGLGFKFRLQLDNTVGIIDSGFAYSDNEGDIQLKITMDAKSDKKLIINKGDRLMQGILIPHGITYNDDVTTIRNGGLGSTGA